MKRLLVLCMLAVGCSGPPQQSFNPADLAIAVGHYDVVTLGNQHLQVIHLSDHTVRRSIVNGDVSLVPRNGAIWGA